MTVYQPLGIRAEARTAWRQLQDALQKAADAGRPVACTRCPDLFFSDDRDDIERAAAMCSWCPVSQLCQAFADANREKAGIWAGVDRTPRNGRRPGPAGAAA